ncbi:MAG: PhoH family protein [Sedimentisphaerales bacterium]|nr:PhoH family protein [Sedimentisphaerales bacterium]
MELTLTLENPEKRSGLFGPAEANLRMLRDTCGIKVIARDTRVSLSGSDENVTHAARVFHLMQERIRRTDHLSKKDMTQIIFEAAEQSKRAEKETIKVYTSGHNITARTNGQSEYIEAISNNDLVFCAGPAGTGKTYLAVAMAVAMLKRNEIRRIVLARPAVEAGEKLGFLPGDLQAKVNPYLRPLFDALGDMMEYAQVKRFMFNDIIEVIPLAFMRGRTFNDSIIILDEAQNTTVSQMLMFLTRLGRDSKMIVTGDDSQVDLEEPNQSGLIDAVKRLKGIKGIAIVKLNESDIVRHRLVQNIVRAYDNIK